MILGLDSSTPVLGLGCRYSFKREAVCSSHGPRLRRLPVRSYCLRIWVEGHKRLEPTMYMLMFKLELGSAQEPSSARQAARPKQATHLPPATQPGTVGSSRRCLRDWGLPPRRPPIRSIAGQEWKDRPAYRSNEYLQHGGVPAISGASGPDPPRAPAE